MYCDLRLLLSDCVIHLKILNTLVFDKADRDRFKTAYFRTDKERADTHV